MIVQRTDNGQAIDQANGSQANGHTTSDRVREARAMDAGGQYYLAAIAAAAAGGKADAGFADEMRSVHAGYFAGGTSRYLPQPAGINPLGTGADYHYRTEREYFLMVERARQDDRDNMIIGQGVNRAVANIMQDGFDLTPDTGDKGADSDLAAWWTEWAESKTACDFEGERTFSQMAALLLRSRFVDGDIFALPLESGQVQVMENHRCRNPFQARNRVTRGNGMVHGVELRNGRRVAYHFTSDDLGLGGVVNRRTPMDRVETYDAAGHRQVWHVYDGKRFTQRRGVTVFAPIVFPLRYHDDLQFAALVNAKRASIISYIHTYEATVQPPNRGSDNPTGNRTTETRADGSTETREEGAPGTVYKSRKPGEKIEAWSPNIPAPQFFKHASLLLTIISINLDLPEIVFLLDATRGNFNSYRGVIDQARQRFEQIQQDMVADFHTPAYQWKVRQWMESNRALRSIANRSGINIFGHRWTPRGWPYLQPVQDAAADDLRLSRNLISPRRRAQERGLRWDDLAREIVADRKLLIEQAIAAADDLNQANPNAGVRWQDLAFGQEGGVRLNLTGTLDGPGDDQTDTDERAN